MEMGKDNTSKRRQKERAKKVVQEQGAISQQSGDDPRSWEREGKEAEKTKLFVTPSVDVQKTMTGSPIFVNEIEELLHQAGLSGD